MNRWIVYIFVLLAMFPTALHAQIPPSLAAIEGKATDVGLGANGVLWAIGIQAVPGGRTIHRWNGTGWDTIPGGVDAVSLPALGTSHVSDSELRRDHLAGVVDLAGIDQLDLFGLSNLF